MVRWFLNGVPSEGRIKRGSNLSFEGFFHDIFAGKELFTNTVRMPKKEAFNTFIKESLRMNRAIGFVANLKNTGNHAMTFWGFEFDEEGNVIYAYEADNNEYNDFDKSFVRRRKIKYSNYTGEYATLMNTQFEWPITEVYAVDAQKAIWKEYITKEESSSTPDDEEEKRRREEEERRKKEEEEQRQREEEEKRKKEEEEQRQREEEEKRKKEEEERRRKEEEERKKEEEEKRKKEEEERQREEEEKRKKEEEEKKKKEEENKEQEGNNNSGQSADQQKKAETKKKKIIAVSASVAAAFVAIVIIVAVIIIIKARKQKMSQRISSSGDLNAYLFE